MKLNLVDTGDFLRTERDYRSILITPDSLNPAIDAAKCSQSSNLKPPSVIRARMISNLKISA